MHTTPDLWPIISPSKASTEAHSACIPAPFSSSTNSRSPNFIRLIGSRHTKCEEVRGTKGQLIGLVVCL